ncbi:MAG TPA: lysophospholipid acyltransferase family protein [Thermoanaerobaculia bacterium]|nr:lysophospholipid acyltransferase family protein [Thermoanaerobaculia bacterium]
MQDREPRADGGAAADGSAAPAPTLQNAAASATTPLRFLASLVFTVTGNAYLLFGTTGFAVVTVLTGWIPLPHGSRFFFVLARWWSRLLLLSSGVRVRSEQLVPFSPDQVYVFLSNHQSLFDIPVLLATMPVPARFLAKRELFRIPVFGWALQIGGFIPVERGGKSAGESFRAAAGRVRRGGSVLLFPEETRSTDGNLLPFKRGGFLLAQKAALPLVPVGIRGTLDARPRHSYRIHPGRVLVRYGEPLPPPGSGRGGSAAAIAQVRAKIAELAGVEAPEEPAAPDGDVR